MALAPRATDPVPMTPVVEDKARNRYPARRALAAAVADVSVQESQALSRAAAEALVARRRQALANS